MFGGGIISRKNTQSIKFGTKGFSLIEMVVAMAIIAIMFAIGAVGLFSARDEYLLDAQAEEMLSMIREAQNNAIAIKKDSAGHTTKVWGVSFNSNNSYSITSLYPNPTQLATHTERTKNLPANMTLASSDGGLNSRVFFSSPFGKSYLSSNGDMVGGASTGCYWSTDTSRPLKDYYIKSFGGSVCTGFYRNTDNNSTGFIDITLSYKGKTKIVRIESNGEAHLR